MGSENEMVAVPEAYLEEIARIIDPRAWQLRLSDMERYVKAASVEEAHGYLDRAQRGVLPSIGKARAILARLALAQPDAQQGEDCPHEAWDEHGLSRRCVDCGKSLRDTTPLAAPSQREGAQEGDDDDEPAAWAIQAEKDAMDAYAQHMGDPDGNDDTSAARLAAARVIEAAAIAALTSAGENGEQGA